MDEEFGSYNFDFTRYTIKKIKEEEQSLTIEGINDFTVGRLLFENLKEGYVPDERMVGGRVFGIRRKNLADDYVLFRIYLDDAEIEYSDIIARSLIYKM